MKRIFISTPIFFIIGFLTFYFWGSSGSLDTNQLSTKIVYQSNYRKSNDTIKVMTFNMGYLSGMTNNLPIDRNEQFFANNLAKAKEVIRQTSPDLIGLQEVDFGSARSFHYNQLDSLAGAGDYAEAYKSVNWDKKYVPFPYWPFSMHFGEMLSGQAILSGYELSEIETIVLDKPINASLLYNAFYLDRLVQISKVAIGGRDLVILNVHLEAFDFETRVQHAEVLRGVYESFADDYPVLLIGDFNSAPSYVDATDAMSILLSIDGISSAISQDMYDQGGYETFTSESPDRMIDYVLFNSNRLAVVDARVVYEAGNISDHLPVIAKLIIK